MKKNIYKLFLIVTSMFLLLSCEDDGKEDFLDEYKSSLYFLNSGVQDTPLYRVGEPIKTKINVSKSGSDLGASAKVDLKVLTSAELDNYNAENGTNYKLLPEGTYTILSNSSLNFGGSDLYKTVEIEYQTEKIDLLPSDNYVLPLALSSESSKVNAKKNLYLAKISVNDPLIYFDNTSENVITITDDMDNLLKYSVQISHNFDNHWNFTAQVGFNQNLLNQYNTDNGVNYQSVPTDVYAMTNNGQVDFKENENYGNLELNIDPSKITSFGNYLLPLSILNVSKQEFKIDPDKKDNIYILSYVPASDKLLDIPLTVGMLSTNAQEPSEGKIVNLIDGDINTYFHTAWSITVAGDHYLQIGLNDAITAFSFTYTTRHNNANGSPSKINIQGSMDGINFFNIQSLSEKLPTAVKETYQSPVIVTPKAKYLRFIVPTNKVGTKYFTMSEFTLKGLK